MSAATGPEKALVPEQTTAQIDLRPIRIPGKGEVTTDAVGVHVSDDGFDDFDAHHPEVVRIVRYKWPIWRVILAWALLIVGLAMAFGGIGAQNAPVGIVGAIIVIPGSYMSFVYVQVWRGNPRFRKEDWLERVEEDDI